MDALGSSVGVERDEASRAPVPDPDGEPRLPPCQAGRHARAGDHEGVDVERVGEPERPKVDRLPEALLARYGQEVAVDQERGGCAARLLQLDGAEDALGGRHGAGREVAAVRGRGGGAGASTGAALAVLVRGVRELCGWRRVRRGSRRGEVLIERRERGRQGGDEPATQACRQSSARRDFLSRTDTETAGTAEKGTCAERADRLTWEGQRGSEGRISFRRAARRAVELCEQSLDCCQLRDTVEKASHLDRSLDSDVGGSSARKPRQLNWRSSAPAKRRSARFELLSGLERACGRVAIFTSQGLRSCSARTASCLASPAPLFALLTHLAGEGGRTQSSAGHAAIERARQLCARERPSRTSHSSR